MFENMPLADLAIGRSTVRQGILALLMLEPDQRLHLREIQRRVGTSPGTASRELARLVAAGLVEREAEGIQVYFRAADNPVAAMMRQLLLIRADGPVAPRPSSIRKRNPKPPKTATARGAEHAEIRREPESVPAAVVELTGRQRVLNSNSARPQPEGEPEARSEPEAEAEAETATIRAATMPAGEVAASGKNVPARENPIPGEIGQAAARGSEPKPLPFPAPRPVRPVSPDALGLLVGARFGAAVRPIYGGRLKSIYLFGIRALGPAADDADVELLVVLDEVEAYGDELEKTSTICAQLSLELGLVVSRVFVAQGQWPGSVDGFVPVLEENRP